MDEPLRILFFGDTFQVVGPVEGILKKSEIPIIAKKVSTKPIYEKELTGFRPQVVIAESKSEQKIREILRMHRTYREKHHPSLFILVAEPEKEEFAIKAMELGIDDYIFQDRLQRLPFAIKNALELDILKEKGRKDDNEKLQLAKILHKSLHEIFVVEPESLKIEYVNQQGLKNLGYSLEELKDRTAGDILKDFDINRFRRILGSVEQSHKGRVFERYAVRKDGSEYPIQIHLEFVEKGKEKKLLANILDISESKDLQEQKELAVFIQNCFNKNCSLTISLELILEELCTRFKIPAAEVWIRDITEKEIKREVFWSSEEIAPDKNSFYLAKEAFRSGEIVSVHEILKEQNFPPEVNYQNLIAFPVYSGNDTTATIIIYTKKIFNQKEYPLKIKEGVQDKLGSNIRRKKTEEELQKIFEFSPDVLAIVGKDGFFKKVNPSLQKILGYSTQDLLSKPFEDLIHPEDKNVFHKWKEITLKDKEVTHYESRWRKANGEYCWFAWSVTPFFKEKLDFAVGKDITDSKEQLDAIKQQNEKLAEIAWEQSHKVRAPLSRLLACISYLEENEEEQDRVLKGVKESARELDQIIKNIVRKTEIVTQDDEY